MRIVINPSTFENEKDAMCVAYNEAFRVVMEETGFDPVSEPTDRQRKFFSDTAYANDEVQLRRTILARICTFDTSVGDPTDSQIQEAAEFLRSVLEGGFPRNAEEQRNVKRLLDAVSAIPPRGEEPAEPAEPSGGESPDAVADELGGRVEDEEKRDLKAGKAVEENPKYDAQGPGAGPQSDADVAKPVEALELRDLKAGGAVPADPRHDAEGPGVDTLRKDERVFM